MRPGTCIGLHKDPWTYGATSLNTHNLKVKTIKIMLYKHMGTGGNFSKILGGGW